jgi:hypothetical protein
MGGNAKSLELMGDMKSFRKLMIKNKTLCELIKPFGSEWKLMGA